ncbi:ABC transporter substrate-binding protein [Pseudoduganella sp. GCM10020061]|uniref:ABC transporter substrate-binding protein n=1 Tax=Pseudoduganella sp. GCM10020061 TaxID=3317345 RepID=UPI003630F833
MSLLLQPPSAHFHHRRSLLRTALAAPLVPLLGACDTPERKDELVIGGLPVTCNLTLPIACSAKSASLAKGQGAPTAFRYAKYGGWPELKESLMAGRVQAAYMLAPLVMDLTNASIPLKVVSLGHRSGAVIMVRTDSPFRRFADLRGKRVAIPSRFAVDYIFLRKMLAREGMTPDDLTIYEMAPPEMPAALYADAVDAYCTGEPFGSAAQRAGYARPLSMTRDEWPNYICCVLTVRQDLIDQRREVVQDLVNHIQSAGDWLDASPANRTKAANIAASRQFFNQDPKVLQFVMENPADRVTYGDLRMLPAEFDELMHLSLQAKTLKRPALFEQYADESFVKAVSPVPIQL